MLPCNGSSPKRRSSRPGWQTRKRDVMAAWSAAASCPRASDDRGVEAPLPAGRGDSRRQASSTARAACFANPSPRAACRTTSTSSRTTYTTYTPRAPGAPAVAAFVVVVFGTCGCNSFIADVAGGVLRLAGDPSAGEASDPPGDTLLICSDDDRRQGQRVGHMAHTAPQKMALRFSRCKRPLWTPFKRPRPQAARKTGMRTWHKRAESCARKNKETSKFNRVRSGLKASKAPLMVCGSVPTVPVPGPSAAVNVSARKSAMPLPNGTYTNAIMKKYKKTSRNQFAYIFAIICHSSMSAFGWRSHRVTALDTGWNAPRKKTKATA
mmetsp:Transcript_16403/g.48906  ORF Transcript_16403/g.48906 Transcript_16403/m.48906 type:complete len:323 (+) Transcript_16403:2475-3443(+)